MMVGAGQIDGGGDQAVFAEGGDGVGDGLFARDEHLDAGVLDLGHGAHTDAAHGDGVDQFALEREERLAMAVGVVQVFVGDRLEREIVQIDEDEAGGGAKMAVDGALEAVIFGNGDAEMHGQMILIVALRATRRRKKSGTFGAAVERPHGSAFDFDGVTQHERPGHGKMRLIEEP